MFRYDDGSVTLIGRRFGDDGLSDRLIEIGILTSWLDLCGSGRMIVQLYSDIPQVSDGIHATDAIEIVPGMAVTE